MSDELDVVIIGAGVSGLASAKFLLEKSADIKLLVLEAKDRVGGRTLCVPLKTKNGTEKFDLGAHWVGRCQPHIMELVEEFGLKTHKQFLEGRKFLQTGKDNSVKSYSSDIPTLSLLGLLDLDRMMRKLDGLAREINQNDPYSHKRAEEFDHTTLESFLNSCMWITESKEVLRIAVRAVMGVECADISVLYFLTYVSAAGGLKRLVEATPNTAQEFTLEGGTQQISEKLAEKVGESRLKLSEPVTRVTQSDSSVVVHTALGNTYTCKKLVLAVPPNQIGKISFEPLLPTAKKELLKRSFMANYVKVLITYESAFWKEDGSSGEFVTCGGPSPAGSRHKQGPLCIGYDDSTLNGNPALVVFLSAAQAVDWREEEAEVKKQAVLASLEQFFGNKVHNYIDYMEKDWDTESYCEGAPISCVSTGAMRYYVEGLRKPFRHIHMAGTETASIWTGYLCGAVQAGQRAAIEILQLLRPHSVSDADVQKNNTPFIPS